MTEPDRKSYSPVLFCEQATVAALDQIGKNTKSSPFFLSFSIDYVYNIDDIGRQPLTSRDRVRNR